MTLYYTTLLLVTITFTSSLLGERRRFFLKRKKKEEEKKIQDELDAVKHLQLWLGKSYFFIHAWASNNHLLQSRSAYPLQTLW